jgi:twitching motility protein PilT
MNKEAPWLALFCVHENLLDPTVAAQLLATMPPAADGQAFAQAALSQGRISDRAALTALVAKAKIVASSGADAPALPVPPPAPAVPTPVKVGQIDFTRIDSLSEQALKTFMLELLSAAQAAGASDLHLSAGTPPYIRSMRALEYLDTVPLSAEQAHKLNTCLLSAAHQQIFSARNDFDYAFAMEGGRRIRVNVMQHKQGTKGTYRIVPERLLSLAELGFPNPAVIQKLLSYHNGLILVTGPVGAGKTTTLNSLINEINQTRDDHIITVEDPIEFLHTSQGCNVTQRQVGQHTANFASALRSALREDPDIIVIGELRDLATIEMAISASETGHLVIGTMHTSDATTTLNRLLDVFPPSQQPQIRAMVAQSLRGVICQRLLPGRDHGLQLACEILINNTAVSAMVRDAKTQGIPSVIETNRREGMIAMDNAVLALWQEKKISDQTAADNILNRLVRQQIPGAR